MKSSYLENTIHQQFLENYVPGRYNSFYLIFTKEWKDEFLSEGHNALMCNLLDTESSIIYTMPIYGAFEEVNDYILSKEYYGISGKFYSLMSYFYEEHHCTCHRHTDAVRSGLKENTETFECAGNRFMIQSITPKDSDLILYSETMSVEELESHLSSEGNSPVPLHS